MGRRRGAVADNEKLAVAKARLTLYYKAEKAILSGQSYEIEGLRLTRADLGKVQDMIADLENKVDCLSAKPRPLHVWLMLIS